MNAANIHETATTPQRHSSFMTVRPSRFFIAALGFIIILNIAIFILANSIPIWWQHGEIRYHNFFWSMDGQHDYNLHSGFKAADFLKPFAARDIDGEFRFRQVSYFLEMISFKFWQYLKVVSFRNYTLIGIHILNCILLWLLLVRLTENKKSAIIGAILFLNSGISLATLFFPFRNAKLVIMTFFLLGWLMIANSKGRFCESLLRYRFLFFSILTFSLFTDEYAFFLIPLLAVYLGLRDGIKGLFNRKIMLGFLSVIIVSLIVAGVFFKTAKHLDSNISLWMEDAQLKKLPAYLTHSSIITDNLRAFFGYFLRRNFGYWDMSAGGILSVIAGIYLLGIILMTKLSPAIRKLNILLGGIIATKLFLLPHNAGFHPFIMPSTTIFPSLLFFSYYYPYCESLLCSISLGTFLNHTLSNNRNFIIGLCMVTFINLSSLIHLPQEGIKDTLLFHFWNKKYKSEVAERKQAAENVLSVRLQLRRPSSRPLYLSFPAGNQTIFTRKLLTINPENFHPALDRRFPFFDTMIPIMYLRDIEKGDVVISLKNVKSKKPQNPDFELANARLFFDVPTNKKYSLEILRQERNSNFTPRIITNTVFEESINLPPGNGSSYVVFFIKGGADFRFQTGKGMVDGQQTYGQSYQIFSFPIDKGVAEQHDLLSELRLVVRPSIDKKPIDLVGPFVIPEEVFAKVTVSD